MLKQLFCTSIIVIFSIFVAFILGFFLMRHVGTQSNVANFLQAHAKLIIFCRFGVYILCVIFWSQIIISLSKTVNWNKEMVEKLIKLRWQVFLFFTCFDVLIICNGLGRLFSLL